MKTLLILRHARSVPAGQAPRDHDRPLDPSGKREAPQIGALILNTGLVPDLIISSTAERARATASAVAEASGYEDELSLHASLYSSGPSGYIEILQSLPADYPVVLVVGHNPDLEILLHRLTGQIRALAPASLAQVTLNIDSWTELQPDTGKLVDIWHTRDF